MCLSLYAIFRNVMPKNIAQMLSYFSRIMVVIPRHTIIMEKVMQNAVEDALAGFLFLMTENAAAIPVTVASIPQTWI